MTNKELQEKLKKFPDDMEVQRYSSAFYQDIVLVRKQKLWNKGKQKEYITIN